MNADIKGMLNYYKDGRMRKKLDGLIQKADGRSLTANEAWAYLCWCDANGYRDLYSAPEFDEVKPKLLSLR